MQASFFHLSAIFFLGLSSASPVQADPPAAKPNAPAPKGGSLPKEEIRRVIREHIADVKTCYSKRLGDHPQLAGTVNIRFVIATTGDVTDSSVQSTTLGDVQAEECIADAVLRWKFPRPAGGVVSVTYPFTLKSEGPPPGAAKK